MTVWAWIFTTTVLGLAAALRAGGASLVRTPRADALHDAAEGDRRATIVASLLEDRARIQPATSVVHSTLLVTASLPAAWALSQLLDGWQLIVGLVVGAVVLVMFGDLLPRKLGREHPRLMAYRLSPLLRLAISAGDKAADLINDDDADESNGDSNGDHDEVDREEIELISSVLEFSDTIVREVMVPRTDMITVASGLTSEEALDLIIEHGFSRIPITGDGIDDVVGIVYAKDLLQLMDTRSEPKPVLDIARTAHHVPETKLVPALLREMQASQAHMAIVVEEFGGTAGLVTIEDLLEELVGEIVDEYDVEAPMVEPLPDGQYLVDARMSVDDLNELLGTTLPDEEWDTVGGLVLGLAGRVPIVGERFELDGAELTPERVQGRRVERVRVGRRSVDAGEVRT
jgi:CBS domain containing-hemolysin-like protein